MTLPEILYEDDALVAFDKPSGLLVAPDRWDKRRENLMGLVHAHPRYGRTVANVHRLDAETSGVLLCAKTKPALDFLSGQFQSKTVEKTYHAVVAVLPAEDAMKVIAPIRDSEGMLPDAFVIELALGEDERQPGRMRVFKGRGGKQCATAFRTLERFGGFGSPPSPSLRRAGPPSPQLREAGPPSPSLRRAGPSSPRLQEAGPPSPSLRRAGSPLPQLRGAGTAGGGRQAGVVASFAFVECRPLTGRTHQLRVHLAAAGAPILCDRFYGDPGLKLLLSDLKRGYKGRDDEKPLIGRLALHASALVLKHPDTREPLAISSPLPHEFEVALKYLRKFAAGRR
jgi:23S rRNA-/tRNA-specific pseudouridylate synthase